MSSLLKGQTLFDAPWVVEYALVIAALVVYSYELYQRQTFWSVLWARGGTSGQGFADYVQGLRDAEPKVQLCLKGRPPVAYAIAEWRDNTRPVDPDGFEGAPRGLFRVSFPLQVLPGDESEASALDFAQEELTNSGESHAQAEVHASIRMTDGTDLTSPVPYVLAEGEEAMCARFFLLLSVPLLLGLVADSFLDGTLSQLAWPVRKVFFTLRGSALGQIYFAVDLAGEVHLEGDQEDLRKANHFWVLADDWPVLWAKMGSLGTTLAWLRRIRIAICFGSGLSVLGVGLAIAYGPDLGVLGKAGPVAGLSLLSAFLCFGIAGLAGWCEFAKAEACAADVQEHFQGRAKCRALWPNESGNSDMVTVVLEQLPSAKSTSGKSSGLRTNMDPGPLKGVE